MLINGLFIPLVTINYQAAVEENLFWFRSAYNASCGHENFYTILTVIAQRLTGRQTFTYTGLDELWDLWLCSLDGQYRAVIHYWRDGIENYVLELTEMLKALINGSTN